MDRLLSIGEVAKRLRVSVDVVRSLTESGQLKAARTGGRHRRYKPEEVDRYMTKGRGAGRERQPERPAKKSRPIDQDLGQIEFEDNPPTLEELEAAEAREAARQRSQAEQERLEGWKKFGRELAKYTGIPTEWRVKIIENLEDFVTTKRVPPTLSKEEGELIVKAYVDSFVKQYREDVRERQQKEGDAAEARRRVDEERQRVEAERRQKEREAEEQRRKQEVEAAEQLRKQQEHERKLKALIEHGNHHAWCETINGWERSEAERARREVERALKDEVKADWSEGEVDDLVDDVLYEGDEDEEDGEEEADES